VSITVNAYSTVPPVGYVNVKLTKEQSKQQWAGIIGMDNGAPVARVEKEIGKGNILLGSLVWKLLTELVPGRACFSLHAWNSTMALLASVSGYSMFGSFVSSFMAS
jgi:hypothetical protein